MMKQKRYNILFLLAALLLLVFVNGCKKADDFHQKLQALPQIDYSGTYAYKNAYIVGDIMVITGRLQPKNNLVITIGGMQADIVKIDSIAGGGQIEVNQQTIQPYEEQVSFVITAAMVGKAREVKITTGGNTIIGTPVDVYTQGGEGSFSSELTTVQVTSATLSNSYKFLYNVNGKGDVYYYSPATKDIRHILKDGTTSVAYSFTGLSFTNFLAGGVDPAGQNLYFSLQVSTGYSLYKLNLQNGSLTALNQSAGLRTPYDGPVNTAQLMVTAIWPDSKGNLYLGMGSGNNATAPNFVPDAVAYYDATGNTIRYIYKSLASANAYKDMPGTSLTGSYAIRLSPDEGLLYSIVRSTKAQIGMGVALHDLTSGALLGDLEPTNTTESTVPASFSDVIAPFSFIKIGLQNQASRDFGYLTLPNRRLVVLLYENTTTPGSPGFPRWIVFDFGGQRGYAYDGGQFQQGGGGLYSFRNNDLLLNYDESGNLYATSNGLSYLIKTQPY